MRTHVSISPAATPTPPRRRPRALTRLLAALTLLLPSLPSLAQQLPNPSFEDGWVDCTPWTSNNNTKTQGKTPSPWKISHVIGMNGTGAKTLGEQFSDENGNSVKIYNQEINMVIVSQKVPGYMSLGTPWSTSVGTVSISAKDGGVFGGTNFGFRPDAIQFNYKRASGTLNEQGAVIAYGWKGHWTQKDVPGNNASNSRNLSKVNMVDRDRIVLGMETSGLQGGEITKSDDAKLIFKLPNTGSNPYQQIGNSTSWQTLKFDFEYLDDADPEMINVIFSVNTNYFSSSVSNTDQDLYIDDVKLLYYSRISGVTIGNEVLTFEENEYYKKLDQTFISDVTSLSAVETSAKANLIGNSKSATVNVTTKVDENKRQLILITVSNVDADIDGEKKHVYTIECAQPKIFSVTIGGTPIALDVNPINYVGYLSNITKDDIEVTYLGVEDDKISKDLIALDNDNHTITISMPEGVETTNPKQIVINCLQPEIKSISINNTAIDMEALTYDGYLVDFIDEQVNAPILGSSEQAIISRDWENHKLTITIPESVKTTNNKVFEIQCNQPMIEDIFIKNTKIDLTAATLSYAGYVADINEGDVTATMPGVAAETLPAFTIDAEHNTITVSLPEGVSSTSDKQTYTIQCWIPVSEIIFPEDMPATMETSDEYTLNLSDFIFEPDGAAETSITMVEIFSIEGVDDGKTGAILTNNVTNYVLKAVDPCTVTIRATSTNGKTKDASVVISPKPLKNITFSDEAYSIVQNLERTFTANNLIFDPENAYDLGFTFSVEGNDNFAWVENNSDWTEMTIFGMNMGDFKICATSTANPEIKAEAPISISDQLVLPRVVTLADNFTLPSPMYIGETNNFKIQIKYLAIGGALVNVNVTPEWTSNNTDILTIDNDGNVALAENVILQSGQQVTVNLKVEAKYNDENDEPQSVSNNWDIIVRQPVTAIDWQDSKGVETTTISMKEHEKPSALAVITPENASDLNIEYTIEGDGDANPIISYDKTTGIISATGFGTNTIVAHAVDFGSEDETRKGKEARLTVKVAAMPKTITIREVFDRKHFWVGKDYTLTAAILPIEAAAASLTWESSDPDVISVDEYGVISVLKVGTANISATAENGESGTISIIGEEYKGLTRDFKGVMTVTDAAGEVNRDENTTITLTTTSDEDLDLSIASLTIKGFPIKDIAATGVQYEAIDVDPETNVPAMIKIFDSNSHNIKLMNGYIDANVTIDGESKFDLAADTAMVKINIVVVNWENEKASAVFSTSGSTGTVTPEEPKDPEEPEEPVVGEGTKTVYPGKISFSVVASDDNGDDEESPAETFVVKTVVTVIDPRPDKTEAHNVDIKIPDLHFGEIDWDTWSSRSTFDEEAENYLYNFHAMTLKGVTASTVGSTMKYEFSGTATADDDETITYTVRLKGTANTQTGDARMELNIMDPVSGEELGGAFANSEDEGDIYSGKLTINMGGADLTEGDGQDATVNIIPSADGLTATFLLPNFTLEGIGALGDIRVDDVEIEDYEDGSKGYYGSVQGMQLLEGAIVADVNLEGYVDADGYAEMTIYVVWSGINIECHFNGKRTAGGNTTGVEAIETATDAPAIYFTIRGIRAAEPLAPGLYIERRGSKARKIIVR